MNNFYGYFTDENHIKDIKIVDEAYTWSGNVLPQIKAVYVK